MITIAETEKKYSRTPRMGLLRRINELENSLVLKGWSCNNCKVFNSEEKEILNNCRSCDEPKEDATRLIYRHYIKVNGKLVEKK